MYAIVDIAGQQFKVEKDQKLFVHRLEGAEGKNLSFEKVMLLDTGSKILVGDPVVKGATVTARILAHVKGDKVLVFKKKRRKGYQKLNGHRQYMTQIQIEGILEKSEARPAEKAAKEVAAEPESETARTAVSKETRTTKKTAAPAKAAAEKKAAPAKAAAEKKAAPAKAVSEKKPAAKKPAASKKSGEEKPAE
jgi:large subunit ribosomal protein L21